MKGCMSRGEHADLREGRTDSTSVATVRPSSTFKIWKPPSFALVRVNCIFPCFSFEYHVSGAS
jgi:hypothetical protein